MGNGNQYADDVVVRVSEYELPPEGSHQAVCVDVVDLGEIVGQYGPVHKVALVFQIEPDPDTGVDVARSDGERFEVVRRFSANLSERGYLRPFLEAWRGKKFTADELRGFHLSKLVGVNAMVQVIHENKGERTYANINTIQPWIAKWGPRIEPQNYTRRVKRPDQQPQERPTRQEAQAAVAAQAPNHRTPVRRTDPDDFGDPWAGESL